MLLISSQQLRELIPVETAIEAVRQVFIDASSGHFELPPRLAIAGGAGLVMVAADKRTGGTVLKGITIRPRNPELGIPAVQAVAIWFDGETGSPAAVIDGATLTAMRTGAASAVASDHLAAHDAAVLVMFGAGGQAPDQIRSVCAVRPIREVRVVARVPARAERLVEQLRSELPAVRLSVAMDVDHALADADIVCTATNATEPLFSIDALPEAVHVNAIGAYTERMCELPPELLGTASILAVDLVEAALAEAGDVIQAIHGGHLGKERLVELGALLADGSPADRHGRTVFKSVGIGAQDWALARLAVEALNSTTAASTTNLGRH